MKVLFRFCPGGHDLLLREGSMPHGRDAPAARFTRAWSANLRTRLGMNVDYTADLASAGLSIDQYSPPKGLGQTHH